MASDFIAKISRKGYDVGTCSDRELVMCSEWPTLKTVKTGTYSIPSPYVDTTLYTHNLGYFPFFMMFDNEVSGTSGNDSYSRFTTNTKCTTATVNAMVTSPHTSAAGRYYIFSLDINKNYISTTINSTDTSAVYVKDDYAFAISKNGADASSTDYRDFVLHSDCKTLMVHQVEVWTETGYSNDHVINHSLGYAPTFFGFTGDGTYFTPFGNTDDSPVIATSTQITIHSVYPATYSIVILKDPILIK